MRGIWKSSIGGDPGLWGLRSLARTGLLRVKLDDELLLHRGGDLPPLGLAQHLRRERVVVGLQPRRHLRGELGGVADHGLRRGPGLDGDDVAGPDLIAGDVDAAAVDRPVAVADELAGLATRAREAEAHQ